MKIITCPNCGSKYIVRYHDHVHNMEDGEHFQQDFFTTAAGICPVHGVIMSQ